jgi:hypothetical protein
MLRHDYVSAYFADGRMVFVPNKDDTYFMIIGPDQKVEYYISQLSKHGATILYESPKAVNRNEGHGDYPRNTLIIFEFNDIP